MSEIRPYVLSIAGFDPSAGAGVLADVKTFEQHQVYGLAIITANTIQTEEKFLEIYWTETEIILKSIHELFNKYPINTVKIGIVPSLEIVNTIVKTVRQYNIGVNIVWDTVLKSSTGFSFLKEQNNSILRNILSNITIITPNYKEIVLISDHNDPEKAAKELARLCPVLLKGGHRKEKIGSDILYTSDAIEEFVPTTIFSSGKHGTGCILSSAIAANLALGYSLSDACKKAKKYIEQRLHSNKLALAYHV